MKTKKNSESLKFSQINHLLEQIQTPTLRKPLYRVKCAETKRLAIITESLRAKDAK